jgi:hypothetical protein
VAGEVFVNEERPGLFILPCKQSDQLVRIPGSISFKVDRQEDNAYQKVGTFFLGGSGVYQSLGVLDRARGDLPESELESGILEYVVGRWYVDSRRRGRSEAM